MVCPCPAPHQLEEGKREGIERSVRRVREVHPLGRRGRGKDQREVSGQCHTIGLFAGWFLDLFGLADAGLL